MMQPIVPHGSGALAVMAAVLLIASALPAHAQPEPLTIRVNDSGGDPGGLVAVVFRTYSPKGVGSGQTCVAPRGPNCRAFPDLPCPRQGQGGAEGPFESLVSFKVFSGLDDTQTTASFDPVTQRTDLQFVSASGTINDTDGPLAVLYYRLRADATFGDAWLMDLEESETFLLDPQGNPIPTDLRMGELRVRAPGDPYALEADGAEVLPGGVAQVAVETLELFDLVSGEIGFLYDPAIAAGPPVVAIDPRYGAASVITAEPTPGFLLISFDVGPGGEPLNSLPGQIFQIDLPTRPEVPIGTLSPIDIDLATTFLVGPDAKSWPLTLGGNQIEFVDGLIFSDGFEDGDTLEWTVTSP